MIVAEKLNYSDEIEKDNFDIGKFKIYYCLNPYSEQYNKIKGMKFLNNNSGAKIIDPSLELELGDALILEDDDWEKIKISNQNNYQEIERCGLANFSVRVQTLSKKYNKYLIPFCMSKFTKMTVRISKN